MRRAIEQTDGGWETLQPMISVVHQECPLFMEQLRHAVQAADCKAVQRAAHAIKGSAEVFAASRVAQLAEHLKNWPPTERLLPADGYFPNCRPR
ncbi:MAG: Hpt domain-containing protein [Pirellulaceae bacterium]